MVAATVMGHLCDYLLCRHLLHISHPPRFYLRGLGVEDKKICLFMASLITEDGDSTFDHNFIHPYIG